MNIQNLKTYFLFSLLAGVLAVSFFVFRPFLYAIVLAMAVAVVFHPAYYKIKKYFSLKPWSASLISTFIIVVFIVSPIVFLSAQIFKEAEQLYYGLATGDGQNNFFSVIKNSVSDVEKFFRVPDELSFDLEQYVKQGLDWFLSHIGDVFSNIAKIGINFFIFIIALYYMFKDGNKLKTAIVALSPLADDDDETIFRKLKVAVNSAVMGNLIIAVIKGLLTSAGFLFFGISSPALWGTVAAVAALVPGIGTAIVFIPAVFFLFVAGKIVFAGGLLAWGMLVVGLVDNFLGPKLIGRGMRLHPMVVLLSVLGGLVFFGPIGFLLGPLVISLLFALLDVYSSLVKAG